MTLSLEWSSHEAYRNAPLREWMVDGEAAGKTRSGGGLTFATVYEAGHMVRVAFHRTVRCTANTQAQVPFDQPVRALELANRWLAERLL